MANLATISNNILADSGIDDINVVVTNGSYSNPAWITALAWSKITGTPTTLSGYGITDAVSSSRTLTINGTSYDLSANRSWSVGTVTSVGLSAPTGFSVSGSPVTSSGTLALSFASGYSLPTTASQANWNAAYNDKINSAAVTGTTTKTLTLTQQDGGTITASWSDYDTAPVTSVNAGTGISVNQTTGAVTVTNTGVLSINGSTGAVTGILTTSNYNSYAPTLTGGGASGTWGINITGNAGYASSAGNADTVDGYHASAFALVNGNTGNTFGVYEVQYAPTNFNPSAGPRNISSMSIKMWNNYFNGTGLGSDYGTVMQYYSLSSHVDTQVYFDAGGGSWYRTASYAAGYGSWQKYVTENGGTWGINITGTAGSVPFNNLTSKTGGTGTYQTSGDFRAPIFYDSQDTAYYVDPNSTSKLVQVNLGTTNTRITSNSYTGYIELRGSSSNYLGIGCIDNNGWGYIESLNNSNGLYLQVSSGRFAFDTGDLTPYNDAENSLGNGSYRWSQVYTSGWFRNYGAQGIYNQSYGTHFYSRSGSGWVVTGSGGTAELQFRSNHESTLRGYVYADTSNQIGFLSEDGNWVLKTWNRGVEAFGQMRAPIFYDSDDTSYYLNPHSTSELRNLYLGAHDSGTSEFLFGENSSGWYGMRWYWDSGYDFYWYGRNAGSDTLIMNYTTNSNSYVKWHRYFHMNGYNIDYVGSIYFNSGPATGYILGNTGGSYGSLQINGTKNGWYGLNFESGNTLMMNSNESGHHQQGYGWKWRWYQGTLYNSRSTYGGGTEYTVLDSGNYTSYAPSLTGSGASGTWGISITGSAGSATYLPTAYVGGQQLNPQVYFNNGIGLKVAMTAAVGYWTDTLWINGYSGGDVPNMCALHTSRQATPRMWISSQSSSATSYGTMYEFITSYNIASQSVSYASSAGNADTLDGYHGSNYLGKNGNSYYQQDTWIQSTGYHGLYSTFNNAHFYPNNGTYGAWKLLGSRNGWSGIEFEYGSAGNISLMIGGSSNVSGFHNNSYGWQIMWESGTLYVGKGTYGGSNATVLDSSNAPYAWNMNQYVRTTDDVTFNRVGINGSAGGYRFAVYGGGGYFGSDLTVNANLYVGGNIYADVLANGNYNPYFVVSNNIAAGSTLSQASYSRVGNIVTVAGTVTLVRSFPGTADFSISLPIVPTGSLENVADLNGNANGDTTVGFGRIRAQSFAAFKMAQFLISSGPAETFFTLGYVFQYKLN